MRNRIKPELPRFSDPQGVGNCFMGVPSDLMSQLPDSISSFLILQTPTKQLPTPWGPSRKRSLGMAQQFDRNSSSRLSACADWQVESTAGSFPNLESVAQSRAFCELTRRLNNDMALQSVGGDAFSRPFACADGLAEPSLNRTVTDEAVARSASTIDSQGSCSDLTLLPDSNWAFSRPTVLPAGVTKSLVHLGRFGKIVAHPPEVAKTGKPGLDPALPLSNFRLTPIAPTCLRRLAGRNRIIKRTLLNRPGMLSLAKQHTFLSEKRPYDLLGPLCRKLQSGYCYSDWRFRLCLRYCYLRQTHAQEYSKLPLKCSNIAT